jgi:hypothetical protein
MKNSSYAKVTAAVVAAWFIFSLSASALHVFQKDPTRPGLAVGLAALIPVLLFLLLFAASPGLRKFALGLDPRFLTLAHTWRVGGITFLVLSAFGILPGIFAFPAGLGDFLIGATAPLMAWRYATPEHRNRFLLWQGLGILDLVTAVSLGTTAGLITQGASAMTVLPLSLVPTFFVPLLLIIHITCIAQARRWPERQELRYREQTRASVA